MEWTREKPGGSGWYDYHGDLDVIGKENDRIHCDPSCRVGVYLGDETYVALLQDTRLYDFNSADGLWCGPIEPTEFPKSKELPGDD
jgi:hypothetical protein